MADFDPGRACSSFRPAHAGRGRRRANELLFVSQATPAGEARFVVKGYAAPGDAPPDGRARLQRELDGEAAFAALGEAVLRPCAGPFESLQLTVDRRVLDVGPALVFPYLTAPTLFDVLRGDGGATREEASALLRRVVGRIVMRHARARTCADLHSDGAAHNILVAPVAPAAPAGPAEAAATATRVAAPAAGGEPALLWFDFAEPHAARDVAEARAVEMLAFLLSVVEASRAGEERARVAAVCLAYGDRTVLARVLALRTPERPALHALRHRLRLRSWWLLHRGDTTQLARYRLLRALSSVLGERGARSAGARQ